MTEETTPPKDFLELRAKREALGLTLKDVFALTRISVVNLEAIETGNFSALPVPLYARNFIKTYARILAVDSGPILEGYEAYISLLKTNVPQVRVDNPEKGEKGQPIGKISHRKTYIITAVVIIAVIAVFIIFKQCQRGPGITGNQPVIPPVAVQPDVKTPEPAKEISEPVTAETGKPVQQVVIPVQKKSMTQLKPVVQQPPPEVEKTKPVVVDTETESLVIKAVEDTWLRITIDRNPPFEVLLKPGETIERKGSDFEVDVGNAGGIKIQFKGKIIEGLGKSGQVIHLRLP